MGKSFVSRIRIFLVRPKYVVFRTRNYLGFQPTQYDPNTNLISNQINILDKKPSS